MISTNLIDIVVYLVIGIIIIAALGSLSKSRFVRTTHKDQFRNRNQIGKQNLGKLKEQQSYRQIAKHRQLEETKNLEPKMNPKVTKSLAVVSKDIREKEE